jgi:RimJ/RimL family protein N-acetyltransferase
LADLGIIIGDKTYWRMGSDTEAIGLVVKYAFMTLNLYKVTTSSYANNAGSIRAFTKAGLLRKA